MRDPGRFVADFDSATGMLRALAAHLRGEGVPMLGAVSRAWARPMRGLAATVNRLPTRIQEAVYRWGGWLEAVSPRALRTLDAEAIAGWMADAYPRRQYPAVAIGSANGAATHLWAALGVPWLPQTFLVPVARSGVSPDEPEREMNWAAPHARAVLERNPDLDLHHMHDPVQDRLMVRHMSYFRFKRRTLGAAYARFLRERLAPGGTIVLVECGLAWPTTRRGERDVFQFGALGGATAEEMLHGGPRVAAYLEQQDSPRRRWTPPLADSVTPEAEWGFAPTLDASVEAFARRHGYRTRRLLFEQPEALSPLVADLHRSWYERLHDDARRLLVDSFILMDPYWTLRTRSVPFWTVFNTEPSLGALRQYLEVTPPFDEMLVTLFSHGVDSIGLARPPRWRELFDQAHQRADFVGVDEAAFPRDFAVLVRYQADLLAKIAARRPLPAPLALGDVDDFLARAPGRYVVTWR